jgi:hypothetical protein
LKSFFPKISLEFPLKFEASYSEIASRLPSITPLLHNSHVRHPLWDDNHSINSSSMLLPSKFIETETKKRITAIRTKTVKFRRRYRFLTARTFKDFKWPESRFPLNQFLLTLRRVENSRKASGNLKGEGRGKLMEIWMEV